jgi:hypothetical protein
MLTFKGNGFTFSAPDKEVAFVANMIATRFSEPVTDAEGKEVFPQIDQIQDHDAVQKWAEANGYPSPSGMLFRHVHRREGRGKLLAALDSFTSPWGFIKTPQAVKEARECAQAVREIPMPYPTDEEAKEEIRRIAQEKIDGVPPKLP